MILDLYLFLVGLCFGSFLGALTYRYLRKETVLKGRSWCDSCGKEIAWYDNIPLFSFLVLGGRCRYCKKKISLRYFLIELFSGIGFVLIGFNLLHLILFLILFGIFIIDFEHRIIPDAFVFAGMTAAIFNLQFSIFNNLSAGFISASFLLLIYLLTKGKGMGLGDVKLAVLGGLLTGLKLAPVWLFLAFLTGAVAGIILILSKKANLKDKIAFGPFLIIAIPLSLVWGNKIINLMGL